MPGGPLPDDADRLGALAEDGRYALRSLGRSPGFSLFMAALIGVGVGAVTLVFSVLRPLAFAPPFEDARELVWISNEGEPDDSSLYAVTHRTVNLIDFRARSRTLESVTGYDAFFSREAYTLTGDGEPERLMGVGVAHDFLDVLGVRPLHGRSFAPEEERPGGPDVIILSHDTWRSRFGADPSIVGRTLTLNGVPRTVVGVLPPEFDFSSVFTPGVEVDFLLPFVVARDNPFQGNVLALVGRLRPGATPEAAQADLDALLARLEEEDPGRWGLGAKVEPLTAHLAGPVLPSLLLLAAAAAALLAMVCVNVVGLILGRAPSREREMAVRKALGASRTRLVRQLVLETLTTALGGALVGSLLAWLGTRALRHAVELDIPLLSSVEVNGPVLAVAVGTAVVAGLLVGVVPALRVAEGGEAAALRTASPGSSAGRGARRWREGLVVAEVALACGLLVVGALLFASFRAVLDIDLGFEPDDVYAWRLHPGTAFESHSEESDFYARLARRVEARAGVERAGLVDALPLGRTRAWPYRVVGRPGGENDEDRDRVFPHVVDPGYLATMKIGLVAGRGPTRDDHGDAPKVVVLNETGARRIFGDAGGALGRRLRFFGDWEWEVVGVARDIRHLSPEMGPGVEVYFPMAQMSDFTTMNLVVRSGRPPARIATEVSAAIARLDPAMPTREFVSMSARVQGAMSERRAALGVLSAFAAVALLIAGIGIYGVLAQAVAERKAEIGIRMALGASATSVVSAVLRRMLALTLVGIALGAALALLATPWVEPLLFGANGAEPAAFVAPAGVLVMVAVVAAATPAWRAVSTDPAGVLKAEG